jgi:hypothetical protein
MFLVLRLLPRDIIIIKLLDLLVWWRQVLCCIGDAGLCIYTYGLSLRTKTCTMEETSRESMAKVVLLLVVTSLSFVCNHGQTDSHGKHSYQLCP